MRRYLLATTGVFAVLVLGACGIPEEQHQATLDELKKLKADMAEMTAKEKACQEDKTKCGTQVKSLTDENTVMKAKLQDLGQDLTKLKTKAGAYLQDISQKQQQIAQLMKAQEAARKRAAEFKGLLAKFKKMIDSGKLKVEFRRGRMIVKMSDKILFDPGKTKLKEEGETALLEVTRILAELKGRNFQVAGHTDNVPIRSRKFKSNWELSAARAVNVVKFMGDSGMDPKRLSAAGYSEYDPVGDNTAAEGRAQNRRIEITLVPRLDQLPGFENLK